ncbi:ATP-binding cassette domain-containing protein [Chitinophaga sp. SYP-B3965]|nr:ATP-binding cassette domain-containing protein [Chitinophaga sp. SYP-B3965]
MNAQHILYSLPLGKVLFRDVHFTINKGEKIGLVGDNGIGKSTLLQIVADRIPMEEGMLATTVPPYYVPQHFGQYDHLSIADVLNISERWLALQAILQGSTEVAHFEALADDWTLEERCCQALDQWGLPHVNLETPFTQLSGGEKTKLFLAGITIHQPELVLLDEPTNHLDVSGRQLLYDWLQSTDAGVLIVSHDRNLLSLCTPIWELTPTGINVYGGDYAFYEERKAEEEAAILQKLDHTERSLREAGRKQREAMERKQKDDAQGARKRKNGGMAKIMQNVNRNWAEGATTRLKDVHEEKVARLRTELDQLREQEPWHGEMQTNFQDARLHTGKILVKATGLNHAYRGQTLWPVPLDLEIRSGDRISISGANGSGKSTLVQLIMGTLEPVAGEIYRASFNSLLLDQEYSLIDRQLTVIEQITSFNEQKLQDHELKLRLNRFLFDPESWDRSCAVLSGGEMMRLSLCCMMVKNNAPDMIVLDEPTNNLDLRNIKILTRTIADYAGTLIVISHDGMFLDEVGAEQELGL